MPSMVADADLSARIRLPRVVAQTACRPVSDCALDYCDLTDSLPDDACETETAVDVNHRLHAMARLLGAPIHAPLGSQVPEAELKVMLPDSLRPPEALSR